MRRAVLVAYLDGEAFELPRSTYITGEPLTREMARGLVAHGVEIRYQGQRCWFGKAGWLDGRPLVIPLMD
jgi:hypothetical protein